MTDDTTDTELFDAWRAGDRPAGEVLISRHYDSIERFFRRKLPHKSDDLVQRTFLRSLESAGRFRREGRFKSYLFGIARNVLLEALRGKKRDGDRDLDVNVASMQDFAPGVSSTVRQNMEQRLLITAIRRIPVEMQVLLELYYWEELKTEELARVFEVPRGTIKSRLHRARSLLEEALSQAATTPDERRSVRSMVASWAQGLPLPTPSEDNA